MSATLLFDRCLTGWPHSGRAVRISIFHQLVTRSALLDRCLTGRGVRGKSRPDAEPPARPSGDRPSIRLFVAKYLLELPEKDEMQRFIDEKLRRG